MHQETGQSKFGPEHDMPKKVFAVVDSLYGNTATLLVGPDEKPISVSVKWLPRGVQEGQVLRLPMSVGQIRFIRMSKGINSAPTVNANLHATVDLRETKRRRQRISDINAQLIAG